MYFQEKACQGYAERHGFNVTAIIKETDMERRWCHRTDKRRAFAPHIERKRMPFWHAARMALRMT